MQEKSLIKRNILQYLEYKGISQYEFYKKTGITRGILTQNNGMSEENTARVLATYQDISPDWLLSGRGDMLRKPEGSNASSMQTNRGVLQQIGSVGGDVIINRRDITEEFPDGRISVSAETLGATPENCMALALAGGMGAPYYDVDFIGGFDMIFNDQTQNPTGYINIPQYGRADLWANISGHSMEPVISNGDIIALHRIDDWQTFLLYGEIYAIVTDNYRTVKRIRKASDPDHLLLEPLNKDGYDEQEIPKEKIRSVWQVIGSVKKLF